MAALMAALVAAMLAQASDRTPWAVAILADRFRRPAAILFAAAFAFAIVNTIGAVAGMLIAPRITPEARTLFLALALANAGLMALFPIKRPDPKGRRSGAFLVSLFALLAFGLGDRTQFLTAAIAARGSTPFFAAAGATLGSLAIAIPATLAGERAYIRLPHLPIRIAIGLLFVLDALWTALGALRLI